MHTIKSLTSGMMKHDVKALRSEQARAQIKEYGEVKHELVKISPIYNIESFCNHLVASMRIATTFWEDVDDLHQKHRCLEWHKRISIQGSHTVEVVARLFNTGINAYSKAYIGSHNSVWDSNGSTSDDDMAMHGPS